MPGDIVLLLVGAAFSGFLSWLSTYIYYKKNLRQQYNAAQSQMSKLTDALITQNKVDATLLRQRRIEECIAEYKRAGTPVRVIDTYADISKKEKAELLDTVLFLVKGRPAKNNKYRDGRSMDDC